MLTLHDINQASPAYIRLLVALLSAKTDTDIADAISKLKVFLDTDLSDTDFATLQQLFTSQGLDAQAIFNQLNINSALTDVQRIYEHWQRLTNPISAVTEFKEWSVDWDTSKVAAGNDDIKLKMSARADTRVEVWNKARAAQQDIAISDADVIVNHEVTGGYSASGASALSSGYATASIGIDHAKEIEFDRYFQYPANTPAYQVAFNSFSASLIIWNLNQVVKSLSPCVNGINCHGLRELSLRTKGSFAFNASLGFGRAWSKKADGNFSDLSASLNLKAGLSKTFEHKGGIHIRLSAPKVAVNGAPQLRAEVELTDANQEGLSFNINANAEITGLDAVAKKYIVPLFNDADELVSKLEAWSSPADKLIDSIATTTADEWYAPLVQLVFGVADSNEVYNQLIATELTTIVNRYAQDPAADATTLAKMAVDKLLQTFDLDSSNEQTAIIAADLSNQLATKFTEWKTALTDEITQFMQAQQGRITEALAPLEQLGVKVQSLQNQTDAFVIDKIKYAVGQYQGFKEKVLAALEKSANIQIGLALALQKTSAIARNHTLVIDFIDSQHALSQSLYKALILGNNKQFVRLLAQAERAGLVNVPQESISTHYRTEKSLSFNLDLSDSTISYSKNINTDLSILVDNLGNLAISGSASATAISKQFAETRQASMALSYDLANALIDENQFAAFAIHYTNKDIKKHTSKEMRDILQSMNLPDGKVAINKTAMPDIIAADAIASHLSWYQSQLLTAKVVISTVDIFIGDSNKLVRTLLNADADFAFELATDRLLELATTEHRREVIDIANAYREVIAPDMSLGQSLQMLGKDIRMNANKIRKVLERNKRSGDVIKSASKDGFEAYIAPVVRTYEKAYALKDIIIILQSSLKLINKQKSQGLAPAALEQRISSELLVINERLGDALAQWVKVSGWLMDWLVGGIDKTLLCFFSILLSLADNPQNLLRVTLTLEDNKGNKTIRVIN
ncbi:MAG: hypothetical protein KKE30_17425 [Gammaproteobacteria bacterium]|nr:hypothetical protein [Gammaproteobacteria bacterium]MBU1555152.1 hypothetical protein [Gammaproteobacteria bacterium]MBU2070254.1 hypothetical protein [Gammaproteobacteria bacterium]MBU2183957.1 hypothetical protein [Gammaproteobacteria bacterium]MBU2206761.1 hypothetical protein [Gammaproteobacteria bacterium]